METVQVCCGALGELPNRVQISLALRRCATLVNTGKPLIVVLHASRPWKLRSDATDDVTTIQLCCCELDDSIRVSLFREIFFNTHLKRHITDNLAANKSEFCIQVDQINDFVNDYSVDSESTVVELNAALADFVHAVNAIMRLLAIVSFT